MRRTACALAAAVVCAVTTAGCAAGGNGAGASDTSAAAGSSSSGQFRGDQLATPIVLSATSAAVSFHSTRPAAPLTTLGRIAAGHRLMVVYFGYTHCPDECPTTMADLAAALRQAPAQVRAAVQVVFVTSDPARDTPPVLARWLGQFDAGLPVPFLGLTGAVAATDAVATSVGVPIKAPVTEPDGTVDVEHGTEVLAFTGTRARLVWLSGTSPADYTHDLTALLSAAAG